MDILQPLLMLDFILPKHLLVHGDLLGQGGFYSILLLEQLAQPILVETIEGLRFTNLAGLLFNLLEGSDLLIEHIVG